MRPMTGSCLFLLSAILAVVPDAHCQTLPRAKVDQIEELITRKMSEDRIPGLSISVVVDGKLVWSAGFGMADLENFVPAKPSTAYRSASIGKTITATAVMQLVERGKIDLEAPIQKYCPAFPEKRWTITTRTLLNHTSGIRHYGGPNNEQELLSSVHYDDVVTPLNVFKNDSLLFEPGSEYSYSTYGYDVLGCIVQGASRMRFMDYLRENIFAPTGMSSTRVDDPYSIIPNRAAGYQSEKEGGLRNAPFVDMSNKVPAGGYITTAEDLARFAIAFMDHSLVSDSTERLMLTPQTTSDGRTIPYGLGWGLFPGEDWYGEKEAFHGGVTPGVSGVLYLLPDRNFAVVMLMNLQGVPGRTGLSADIAKTVLDLRAPR